MMKTEFNQAEYVEAYQRENMRQIRLKLNRKTEPELIAWLESKDNIQGYIKDVIRKIWTLTNERPFLSVSFLWNREHFYRNRCRPFIKGIWLMHDCFKR